MTNHISRYGTTQRWSDVVVHHSTVYTVEVASTLPASPEAQTREILAQLEETLDRVGSSKDRLLTATIFLADTADYETFNTQWDRWLPVGTAPVRACVQVVFPNPEVKVEIQITAAVG